MGAPTVSFITILSTVHCPIFFPPLGGGKIWKDITFQRRAEQTWMERGFDNEEENEDVQEDENDGDEHEDVEEDEDDLVGCSRGSQR